jgi:hypothetical protein
LLSIALHTHADQICLEDNFSTAQKLLVEPMMDLIQSAPQNMDCKAADSSAEPVTIGIQVLEVAMLLGMRWLLEPAFRHKQMSSGRVAGISLNLAFKFCQGWGLDLRSLGDHVHEDLQSFHVENEIAFLRGVGWKVQPPYQTLSGLIFMSGMVYALDKSCWPLIDKAIVLSYKARREGNHHTVLWKVIFLRSMYLSCRFFFAHLNCCCSKCPALA